MKKLLLISAVSLVVSVQALADDFTMITGGEGGGYERLGHSVVKSIAKQARKRNVEFDYKVLNSAGSVENIECINSGDCQAAIVQADALNVMPPTVPFKSKQAGKESVFWIFNKKLGIDNLSDIEGKKDTLMVIVDGSGAMVTMQSFVQEDEGYKVNLESAILADDVYDAADIVSEGKYNGKKVAGMLYVGSKIPPEIAQDFVSKVSVGEATDSDFNDAEDVNGDPLYASCDITKGQLSGLSTSTFGDPDTVCLRAMVVYTTDFDQKGAVKAIKKGVNKALRGVK